MNCFDKLLLSWKYRRNILTALGNQIRILNNDSYSLALGGLTKLEIDALISWLPKLGVFIEFGTLFGLTSKAVAFYRPDLRIIAVDNFSWNPFGLPPKLHEEFTRNILSAEIATGQVEIVNMTSQAYRDSCNLVPSAVFFDAQHQYSAICDEIKWARKLKIPCICGHDYANQNPIFGVTKAVDEAFPNGVDLVGMCWRGINPTN